MLEEKYLAVKDHIYRNRVVYISGGICFLAGFTCAIMRGRHAELLSGSGTAENSVFVRPLSFLSKQETTTIVNVVKREGRGHPGYMVRCLETGNEWVSQHQAAIAQGVSDAIFSLHLRGKLPDINGLHFERIETAA